MPYYVAPATAEDRLFVFDETLKFHAAETAAGRPSPITATTLPGVTAYVPTYRPLATALQTALGERSREVSEADTARTFLEMTVRDYIEVLKRRTLRKKHAAAVLINHGLNESGDVPSLDRFAALGVKFQ